MRRARERESRNPRKRGVPPCSVNLSQKARDSSKQAEEGLRNSNSREENMKKPGQ